MDIKDGTVRINAGYSLKLPSEQVQYASQDQHLGVSIEFPLDEDVDFEVLTKELIDYEHSLASEVKLAVFAQLGVQPTEIGDNILAPDLSGYQPAGKDTKGKSSGSSTGRRSNRSNSGRSAKSNDGGRSSGRSSGGRSAGRTTRQSNASRDDLPIVTLEGPIGWNGADIEPTDFYDQRPLKREGEFKPRAADFQEVDGKLSLWMTDRDGLANDDVLDALDDAGVDYDEFEFVT